MKILCRRIIGNVADVMSVCITFSCCIVGLVPAKPRKGVFCEESPSRETGYFPLIGGNAIKKWCSFRFGRVY